MQKKKSTHPEKKAQKALQHIKKKRATEKKPKKALWCFKSTHYDPCEKSRKKSKCAFLKALSTRPV